MCLLGSGSIPGRLLEMQSLRLHPGPPASGSIFSQDTQKLRVHIQIQECLLHTVHRAPPRSQLDLLNMRALQDSDTDTCFLHVYWGCTHGLPASLTSCLRHHRPRGQPRGFLRVHREQKKGLVLMKNGVTDIQPKWPLIPSSRHENSPQGRERANTFFLRPHRWGGLLSPASPWAVLGAFREAWRMASEWAGTCDLRPCRPAGSGLTGSRVLPWPLPGCGRKRFN